MRTSIGERLREERTRLGLSQTDFAQIGGAAKRTQIEWEKGSSTPTAEFLAAVALAGADVLFIVTGRRSPEGNPQIAEVVRALALNDPSRLEIERLIVELIPRLDGRSVRAVLGVVKAMQGLD